MQQYLLLQLASQKFDFGRVLTSKALEVLLRTQVLLGDLFLFGELCSQLFHLLPARFRLPLELFHALTQLLLDLGGLFHLFLFLIDSKCVI